MMPWCITNGNQYLFGLVRQSGEVYQSVRLDKAITFDKTLKNPSELKTIMKTLVFWVRNLLQW